MISAYCFSYLFLSRVSSAFFRNLKDQVTTLFGIQNPKDLIISYLQLVREILSLLLRTLIATVVAITAISAGFLFVETFSYANRTSGYTVYFSGTVVSEREADDQSIKPTTEIWDETQAEEKIKTDLGLPVDTIEGLNKLAICEKSTSCWFVALLNFDVLEHQLPKGYGKKFLLRANQANTNFLWPYVDTNEFTYLLISALFRFSHSGKKLGNENFLV